MSSKRLFVEQSLTPGHAIVLDGAAAHYLGRVLRARVGTALRVFNGDGTEYAATVHAITRDQVSLALAEQVAATPEPQIDITLMQALSRNEKMDLVIQKAVELGVRHVRPVAVERSVMRLDDDRVARRLEHWRQVAVHAAQQSGRAVVPDVHAPASLDAALHGAGPGFGVVADPDAPQALGVCLAAAPARVAEASVLIGPEGGFTRPEIEQAVAAGMLACRAGPRILRTETAALALVTVLQWRFGDLPG